MIRMLELPPDLAEAVAKEERYASKVLRIWVIIREETLEQMKRQMVEEELDRSFFEFDDEEDEDETPLEK